MTKKIEEKPKRVLRREKKIFKTKNKYPEINNKKHTKKIDVKLM